MPPALAAVIPAIVGGVASTAGGLLEQKSKNKQQEKMATIDRTKSGFTDFGEEMTTPDYQPNLSLSNSKRPIIFGKY